jgi:DNA-nicking Smr family endonuclease
MTRRSLSPEEARAWARVAATVKPIGPRAADLDELSAALGSGEPLLPEAAPVKASRTSKPESPKTPAPPAERSGEKKVRRGKLTLAAQFDLH